MLDISLPEALESYVKERAAEPGYATPDEYVCALVRDDQRRRAREELDRLLLEGLESEPQEVTPEHLAELRREARARIDRPQRKA